MSKYWKQIVVGVILGIVVVPLGVASMVSFRVINTDTTNEWIGFWGGYLGSIIGGIITLFVMYITNKESEKNLNTTLNFEKIKMLSERKTKFNDELLNQVIDYQTAIEDLAEYMSKVLKKTKPTDEEYNFQKELTKIIILSKILTVKLKSKESNPEYRCIKELIESVRGIEEEILGAITKLTLLEGAEDKPQARETARESIENLATKAEKFMEDIEKYYVMNEEEHIRH